MQRIIVDDLHTSDRNNNFRRPYFLGRLRGKGGRLLSFRPFKQTDRSSCVTCVAAMATRTHPDLFVKFVQALHPDQEIKPPYSDIDLQKYLLEFGMIIGIGAGTVSRDNEGTLVGEASFDVKDYPAYVSVKSERDDKYEHALYWDGSKLWDPNPLSQNGRDPLSYSIVGWWPIIDLRLKK